ncbi:MAG: 5'/3'-nucleotidase SurE [Proteobacteria bacterium]|nr:5'/3'-nucleotidase SurE [Pseudomonadota bacterium]
MTAFRPLPLKDARILLTNDDGIAAPGLKVLERVARQLSRDIWVVAPELEQSGAGHSLTLRRPLRIRQLGRRRFAVDGTPTDAVLLAVNQIMRERKPTLVLSGVNRGGNLGEDVTYSGTIAAAMEATLLGVPAVALSLEVAQGKPVRWDAVEAHAPRVIRDLAKAGWPTDVFLNINFPDRPPDQVGPVQIARQGRRKIGDQLGERLDMRGEHYYWIGPMRTEEPTKAGTDLAAVNDGRIAVTPLHLDLTHGRTARHLERALS